MHLEMRGAVRLAIGLGATTREATKRQETTCFVPRIKKCAICDTIHETADKENSKTHHGDVHTTLTTGRDARKKAKSKNSGTVSIQ